jgi:hypothetical protein
VYHAIGNHELYNWQRGVSLNSSLVGPRLRVSPERRTYYSFTPHAGTYVRRSIHPCVRACVRVCVLACLRACLLVAPVTPPSQLPPKPIAPEGGRLLTKVTPLALQAGGL